jgi:hypothetical protein
MKSSGLAICARIGITTTLAGDFSKIESSACTGIPDRSPRTTAKTLNNFQITDETWRRASSGASFRSLEEAIKIPRADHPGTICY